VLKSVQTRKWLALGVAAITIIGLAGWRSVPAPTPTVVAIVDITRVVDPKALKEVVDRNAEVEARQKQYEGEIDKMDKEITSLKEVLEKGEVYQPGTQEYRQKVLEFEEKRILRKARHDAYDLFLAQMSGEIMAQMYDKVLAAVDAIARKDAYDLVLVDDRSIVPSEKGTMQQVTAAIQARRILWAAERIDITQQVIDKMNADYAAGKKN